MQKTFVYLFLATFFSSAAFAQKKAQPGIAFKAADKSHVSVFIVLKDLPKQRFLFTVPEIFTGRNLKQGLFNSDLNPWKIRGQQASRGRRDSLYRYDIKLQLKENGTESRLDWIIEFENNSPTSLFDLAAFNCLTMNFAPMFQDTLMNRTWVKDTNGNTRLLKDVNKTTGPNKRTMQFYHAAGGVADLAKNDWINNWNVVSPDTLSGNKMWLASEDGKWKIETVVDGQTAYFFNNWEGDHGCIHASPLFAKELKAGEKATASGSFRFIRN
jgi:hypothetical protein